jgi:hypothetical protein
MTSRIAHRPQNLLPLAALLLACSGEPEPAAPVNLTGTWRLRGNTTALEGGETRAISGSVVLVQEGDGYTATFSLETLYPTPGGPLPAELVGRGDGKLDGRRLTGTAHTQIVASRVPGLDPNFALVPPAFTVRIVSETRGRIDDEGHLTLKIRTRGEEGERGYAPTRTRLHGERLPPGEPAAGAGAGS